MANEKVSQMTSLTAAEVAGEDLFLITDMSARESKKISAADVLSYIETTGSFNAYHALTADTASYIAGGNVDGPVVSASYSKTSSLSHLSTRALNADSASIAATASYVNINGASVGTASFLNLNAGASNGTASYSLTSSFVNLAKTSSFLLFTPGLNNGTASYAISSSIANFSLTASTILDNGTLAAATAISASWASASLTASYALNNIASYQTVLSYTAQVGTGGTPAVPFSVVGLQAKIRPKSANSNFLIILSTVISNGAATSDTSIALWRSSSISVGPLIKTYSNYNGDDADAISFTTTYVDSPSYDYTTPVTYSAQVYNEGGGSWYVNRSRSNNFFGTSSLTVIEFVT